MKEVHVSSFSEAARTLRNQDLAQSMYDEGRVIMADVLLTLHGDEHRSRRRLENRIFRREVFGAYEREIFPPTIEKTLAPAVAARRADLVEVGYRITMNLTADFAGVDRPAQTLEETAELLSLVRTFSEGATLVHSTRNKDEVRGEVREAMTRFERVFLAPSIARRRDLLARFEAGQIEESALPWDVLTVLLRNEERLPLSHEVVCREIAFYLQAGAHSTANSTTHAFHEIFNWCEAHPEDRERIDEDPFFVQRCVHESMRLHPASPVAWRKPLCPIHLATGDDVVEQDRVVIDMLEANRDPEVFGPDADRFNPYRELPRDVMPFGLTFGKGPHACPGQDLDGGLVPGRGRVELADHLFGTVTTIILLLLEHGARPDPGDAPVRDPKTARPNWGRYPILIESKGASS